MIWDVRDMISTAEILNLEIEMGDLRSFLEYLTFMRRGWSGGFKRVILEEVEVMGRDVERGGREDRGVEGGSLWVIHPLGHVWVWAIYGYALPKPAEKKFQNFFFRVYEFKKFIPPRN